MGYEAEVGTHDGFDYFFSVVVVAVILLSNEVCRNLFNDNN